MSDVAAFILARVGEDEARAPRKREDYYEKPCPKCGRSVSGLGSPLDDEAVRALHPDDLGGVGCPLSVEQWNVLMPDLGPSLEGARVLAECAAKRAIVERCQGAVLSWYGECDGDHRGDFDAILHALALPYADHPDYREEWAP